MVIKTLMLFAYDFPHKKTQDFIFRLRVEGYNIKYVIAAPWKKLNIAKSIVRVAPKHEGLVHPEKICRRFGIRYIAADHNSMEARAILSKNPVDLCIISGARILCAKTIEAAEGKIVNIHPGLLPEVRGLDTLLWSIHHNLAIGISAHFVSRKIDSGMLIHKEKLALYKDDTLRDVGLRLLERQTDVLVKALSILKKRKRQTLRELDGIKSSYHTKMPAFLEKEAVKKFPRWLAEHSNCK